MQLSNGAEQPAAITTSPSNGVTMQTSRPTSFSVVPADRSRVPTSAASDRSSSLSELDDMEYQEGLVDAGNDLASSGEEDDTEAETERLHISPDKSRALARGASKSTLSRQVSRQDDTLSDIDEGDSSNEHAGLSVQPMGADTTKGRNVTSAEAAGRKRKRTSSLIEPPRKRISSGLLDKPARLAAGAEVAAAADDDELSDPPEDDEGMEKGLDDVAVKSPTPDAQKIRDDDVDSSDRELSEPPEEAKTPPEIPQEGAEAVDGLEAEAEVEVEPDAEEEDGETAAKSEDERKYRPVSATRLRVLMNLSREEDDRNGGVEAYREPFCDLQRQVGHLKLTRELGWPLTWSRLFDERLAGLAYELALLQSPSCQHSEYLAMRQTLDARREEKIELEQVSLGYKLQVQERKVVAERAQIHSQYHQAVRELREEHMASLNKRFAKVQHDRRKFNTPQTSYGYRYNPQRAEQIARQRSYNKEISLLSGMAKYVGFPSGPQIPTPKAQQVEEDLRSMKIRPNPPQYVPQLANTRVDDSISDESWLERNAWANPNHPASQHVRYNGAYATPGNQRRTVEVQYGPIGSGSTIPFAPSDPPSSSMAQRVQSELPPHENTSPFEQMKRRNLDARQRNDVAAQDPSTASNGTRTIDNRDERLSVPVQPQDPHDHGPVPRPFPTPVIHTDEPFNRERHDVARAPISHTSKLLNGSGPSPAPPAERIGVR